MSGRGGDLLWVQRMRLAPSLSVSTTLHTLRKSKCWGLYRFSQLLFTCCYLLVVTIPLTQGATEVVVSQVVFLVGPSVLPGVRSNFDSVTFILFTDSNFGIGLCQQESNLFPNTVEHHCTCYSYIRAWVLATGTSKTFKYVHNVYKHKTWVGVTARGHLWR